MTREQFDALTKGDVVRAPAGHPDYEVSYVGTDEHKERFVRMMPCNRRYGTGTVQIKYWKQLQGWTKLY